MRLPLNQRIAILLHEGLSGSQGKTGLSILRYSESPIVAVIDRQAVGKSIPELTGINRDVPIVPSLSAALVYQPEVLVIGIAPKGGAVPDDYWTDIKDALKAGMSLVNGLHTPLASIPELNALLKPGQLIWDVRKEPSNIEIASAMARNLPCRRVLTVGTDMAIGKMSTSLELNRAGKLRGLRSKFLATGQAGVMLEGDGIALDAVRVDFAAGAVEQLVMRFGQHYDILHIEGQGSLLHPGSTATLPLIRGSQPTHLILVHKAGQTHNRNNPHIPIPPLPEVIKLYEAVASGGGAFARVPVVGIALNTKDLDKYQAEDAIAQTIAETNLPCTDPVRFGAEILLDAILQTV
ncbi:hypothetical protein B6N60_02233 [Richelia sinica FACHB-800]|uniref:DUF1611 domain-containing protein n=1 Tax=Richelia sinica FACHB-800 TaxID=1357546 RepID=A0A975T8T0_9NOST|nr:DUF1611 domain-containing protein [Richelia sinica]MBD2666144.1 DUF1611 domain-containing protein [Richelia sinica FACHB-800]QXE23543.1 hypothetical protein B6N60_02233 [Richelia sinica FACHB-800]